MLMTGIAGTELCKDEAQWLRHDAVAGVSVEGVVESQAPLRREYQPNHPLADETGYVFMPNVNMVEEMANMISASRSYQTNIEVMDASKRMLLQALSLGQ